MPDVPHRRARDGAPTPESRRSETGPTTAVDALTTHPFVTTRHDPDDPFPAYGAPDWHPAAVTLIRDAADAEVIPHGTQIWIVADSDGVVEGVLLTLDVHPRLRLCTHHLDWRDLTDDREATGTAGMLAVLRAVVAILATLTGGAAAAALEVSS